MKIRSNQLETKLLAINQSATRMVKNRPLSGRKRGGIRRGWRGIERGWREACEKVPIVKRRWGGEDYERTAEGLREGGGGLGEGGDWKKAVGKITRQRLMD